MTAVCLPTAATTNRDSINTTTTRGGEQEGTTTTTTTTITLCSKSHPTSTTIDRNAVKKLLTRENLPAILLTDLFLEIPLV